MLGKLWVQPIQLCSKDRIRLVEPQLCIVSIRHWSRNKRRNKWGGWCVSSWQPCVFSIYSIVFPGNWNRLFPRDMNACWMIWYNYSFLPSFKCMFQLHSSVFYFLYQNMGISTLWYNTLVSCTPSRSIGCALFWCWLSLSVLFISSLTEYYFIMIVVIISGIVMAILFILKFAFRLFVLSSSSSANVHLPVCLRPWTLPLNIALNMLLPSDSFMSCLEPY